MKFYSDTLRPFDLSNKAESVMDLMVDAGIIKDDNYKVCPLLILEYGGLDKLNPRVDVELWQTTQ